MSTNLDRVRSEALQLSEIERAELARDLVRSLDAPEDADTDKAWEREISQRLSAIDAGTAALIDRDEFRRRIQARLTRP
jgi:putative addiction module component (TIGR02574 family)